MTLVGVDNFSRTAKLLVDRDGVLLVEAATRLRQLVLQVDVDEELLGCPGLPAAFLTVVNAGRRAFRGGIRVRLRANPTVSFGWFAGRTLAEAAAQLGAELVDVLVSEHPTVAFGARGTPAGRPAVVPTWSRWSGGVVTDPDDRLDESEGTELSAVLAGAVAVSEAFQRATGTALAGRRRSGVSLWSPKANWRDPTSLGPKLSVLPENAWLVGVGHLGQAYAWSLGLLPYADNAAARLAVQDDDTVSEANLDTSLLTEESDLRRKKARVVADRLDRLGFETMVLEQRLDGTTRRRAGEPEVALGGLDSHSARRALSAAGFRRIIDAGLGHRHDRYLDVFVHSLDDGFPGLNVFPDIGATEVTLSAAYEDEVRRRHSDEDLSEADARCGVVQLAGVAVGASFVGAFASTLVVAEVLRPLHGGPSFNMLSANLANLAYVTCSPPRPAASVPVVGGIPVRER